MGHKAQCMCLHFNAFGNHILNGFVFFLDAET